MKKSTCQVSYVASWDIPIEGNRKERRSGLIQVETETAIRVVKMKHPFNALDVKNQATEDVGSDLTSFVIIGIIEFESDEEYAKFFSHPIP